MNNYVVTDIHGNAERLEALLQKLKSKHPVGDFKLYIMGDLFDRGDESAKVLSLVLKNQGNVEVLKGNHEYLFMNFMQSPAKNYISWQMNYSYPTIMSFIDHEKEVLFKKYCNADERQLENDCYIAYMMLSKKLKTMFGDFDGNHSCDDYINQITKTVSSRDIRNIAQDYTYTLRYHYLKDRSSKYIQLFSDLTYLHIVDKFCEVYEYFSQLKPYALVDDDYLLVHSGFVNVNKDSNVEDTLNYDHYNYCERVEDLPGQKEYPMIWARRKNLKTGKAVPPERFDDKIIIYGHTITEYFNDGRNDYSPHFYYKNGKLQSVGIDGCNAERYKGQLNCLCLKDLSQIIVKGTNFAYLNQPNSIVVEEIEYQPEVPQPQ